MLRTPIRRLWKHAVIAGLLFLLVPYMVSRIASPVRRIIVYDLRNSVSTPINSPGAPLSGEPKPGGPLRILSYNIAHGRGESDSNWTGETILQRTGRLDAIAILLKQINADVVVLNEADFDTSWSDHVDQARYLAAIAGYRYVAEQRNLDFRVLGWTWRFGNAVLSKHPINDVQVIDLPGYAAWETILAGKKRAIDCSIQLSDNRAFRLIAAHLSPRSEQLRVESVKEILRRTSQCKTPVIIAGDLNSAPPRFSHSQVDRHNQNAIGRLDESKRFQLRPENDDRSDVKTYPANTPDRVIDWIAVSNVWSINSYQVVDSVLSDHRPVVADVNVDRLNQK